MYFLAFRHGIVRIHVQTFLFFGSRLGSGMRSARACSTLMSFCLLSLVHWVFVCSVVWMWNEHELSLLYHYCRGDTLTPSYRCYPILWALFSEPVEKSSCFDQVLTKCYLRAEELSLSYPCLDHHCRGDTLTPSYRCYPILLTWFSEPV